MGLCSFQRQVSFHCLVVMGEGSFDAVLRNDIHLSANKSSVKFRGGCMMVFGMSSAAGTGPCQAAQ